MHLELYCKGRGPLPAIVEVEVSEEAIPEEAVPGGYEVHSNDERDSDSEEEDEDDILDGLDIAAGEIGHAGDLWGNDE